MKPNIKAIQSLIDQHFNGNKTEFALKLQIERSQVSQIINHGIGAGSVFFGALMKYCEENALDFKEYVIISERSNSILS